MAHVKENDVMIDFYLCPTLLQKKILDTYQNLGTRGEQRESLLDYLEDQFITEIRSNSKDKRPSA